MKKVETYRQRAIQLRRLSDQEDDEEFKQKLLRIAEEYEEWANRLEPLAVR